MNFQLINDEPVSCDTLGRKQLVKGLVAAVKECETPFVLAINGQWGSGKTSILKCMEHEINVEKSKNFRSVWFSPWKFQFEDSPAVSLLQQIRHTAIKEKWISTDRLKKEVSKLLNIVGTLAGEIVFKAVTGQSVSTADIMNQGAAFEEKYFEAKQLTSRMQDEFKKVIDELVGKNGRLIFFIDDLDRCRTDNALRLLEALKLFFNAPNCVYVVAIDMENLVENLQMESKLHRPKDYLEKIFQMVYTFPQPGFEVSAALVKGLLEKSTPSLFEPVGPIWAKTYLADFLGHTPRALKHFCNRFIMESALVKESLGKDYDPARHIFLQLLQHCFPNVYRWFQSECLLVVNSDPKTVYDNFIYKCCIYFNGEVGQLMIEREPFESYFKHMPFLTLESPLEAPYIVVTVTFRNAVDRGVLCIENHKRNGGIARGTNLSEEKNLAGVILRNLNLGFCMLDRSNFEGADFSKTDLSYADCSRSLFKNATFIGAKTQKTLFRSADLEDITFEGADFAEADFTGAKSSAEFKEYIKPDPTHNNSTVEDLTFAADNDSPPDEMNRGNDAQNQEND